MSLRVKAVIMRPDHTVKIHVVPKRKLRGKTFRVGEYEYFLHPDRFMITSSRQTIRWPFKTWYSTYYYKEGMAQPVAVPDFPKTTDNGISSEELAAIFNPWFYRIIGNVGTSNIERLIAILAGGAVLGIVYVIFLLTGIGDDLETIKNILAPPPPPGSPQ